MTARVGDHRDLASVGEARVIAGAVFLSGEAALGVVSVGDARAAIGIENAHGDARRALGVDAVLDDGANGGIGQRDARIDQTYQLKCYNQALSHLDEDTLIYGSAVRDIKRALASAVFGFNTNHPGGNGPGPNSLLPPPGGGKPPTKHNENFFQRLAKRLGGRRPAAR